jgi:hypothetical protein
MDYTNTSSTDLLDKHQSSEAAWLVLMRAADYLFNRNGRDLGDDVAVDILDDIRAKLQPA